MLWSVAAAGGHFQAAAIAAQTQHDQHQLLQVVLDLSQAATATGLQGSCSQQTICATCKLQDNLIFAVTGGDGPVPGSHHHRHARQPF